MEYPMDRFNHHTGVSVLHSRALRKATAETLFTLLDNRILGYAVLSGVPSMEIAHEFLAQSPREWVHLLGADPGATLMVTSFQRYCGRNEGLLLDGKSRGEYGFADY